VPSVRALRILLDKDGSLARLQQEAFAFRWELLQPAADAFADDVLQQMPEYVHKLLGGIATRDESMMAFAAGELAHFVTGAVATQRGMLVVSQNTLYRQLWEEFGLESAWTRVHAATVGSAAMEHTPVLAPLTLIARAFAALRLYIETIRLLRPILLSGTQRVADESIRIIQQVHPGLEQQS